MLTFIKKYRTPIILGLIALTYYLLLCAKSATWIFTGTDNGDWLAAATTWMAPQPYGSPLYVWLCRFFWLFPGELALKLTVALSVIPATVTVVAVYLTARHLTKNVLISVVAGLVVLGSTVFLTQATILEEYSIATMFLALATYAYVREWKYRTVVFLGLGIAVHVMLLVVAVFWLLADRRWKMWLGKPLLVLFALGILPYAFIPLMMMLDTPRWLVGEFSISNLFAYLTTTSKSVSATISIFETPKRVWVVVRLISMSYGLALVPLLHNIYKPLTRTVALLLAVVLFVVWYVVSCIDPSAWTFLTFMTPAVAVLIAIALTKVTRQHVYVVGVGACMLMLINGFFLNANVLTNENPRATTYFGALRDLPDQSVVVTITGGYSLGLFYVVNDGKDVTAVIYPYVDSVGGKVDYGMRGYEKYLLARTGFDWTNTFEGVQECLNRNVPVYFVPTPSSAITQCFVLDMGTDTEIVDGKIYRVEGLTGIPPKDVEVYIND